MSSYQIKNNKFSFWLDVLLPFPFVIVMLCLLNEQARQAFNYKYALNLFILASWHTLIVWWCYNPPKFFIWVDNRSLVVQKFFNYVTTILGCLPLLKAFYDAQEADRASFTSYVLVYLFFLTPPVFLAYQKIVQAKKKVRKDQQLLLKPSMEILSVCQNAEDLKLAYFQEIRKYPQHEAEISQIYREKLAVIKKLQTS